MPIDRIREYLRRLTSQARNNLLVEIERIQLYGEDIPGSDIILAELRAELRTSGQSQERAGNPSRSFFKSIEGLLVDRSPERANSGELSRGSLSAIWEWFNQTLLPTMARDYCADVTRAIATNNPQEAARITAAFHSKVIKCLEGFLAADGGIESARAGLGQYTSSRASFDDLTKILSALRVRDAIVALDEALPPKLDKFEGKALVKTRALLDGFVAKHPKATPFALTLVARRLKTPWQLFRLATKMAPTKNVEDVKATRYAISVSMVLDHLDDKRLMLRHALKSNRVVVARDVLADIYGIERALRLRIDRLENSDWGRRLDELMDMVAADLKTEIEALPDNLQHVLGSKTLHRQRTAPGLVSSLIYRGRELVGLGY